MNQIFIEALVIGFVGAILFVAVDRLEHNGSVANFLKLLVSRRWSRDSTQIRPTIRCWRRAGSQSSRQAVSP
jgi:hypothetical protein